MSDITLRETSYSNCGQRAWAVENDGRILFYLVCNPGFLWSARSSLGRGYTCGAFPVLFGVQDIRAKRLETAKRKVFKKLESYLRIRAAELDVWAYLLDSEVRDDA